MPGLYLLQCSLQGDCCPGDSQPPIVKNSSRLRRFVGYARLNEPPTSRSKQCIITIIKIIANRVRMASEHIVLREITLAKYD